MSKGGGGGGTNTVQSSQPPDYILPYLTQAAKAAQGIYNQGAPSLYPTQTYAPINSTQQQALDQTLAYGTSGPSQATQTGINALMGEANSNPDPMQNPYIANLVQQQGLQANQIVAGNFNTAGRYGSGSQAAAAGTAVTNAQLPTLAAQYNTDMATKMAAANALPNASTTQQQQILSQAQAVGTVGDQYANQAQQAINDAITRYQYANGGSQNMALQNYYKNLTGPTAQGGTSSSTTSNNSAGVGGTIGSIVSGLGSIYGLSNMVGGLGSLGTAGITALAGGMNAAGAGTAAYSLLSALG